MKTNRLQGTPSKNTILWPMLTFFLLLPLVFVNIKDSHDWGDDFAMYLKEAQNLATHSHVGESGFMINPNAMMGPQTYPVGFPLLLAPVVSKYGLNFHALNIYQSLMLICTLWFGFLFLYRHFSGLSSLLITLVIAYNPVILNFKTEILSDIPFWGLVNIILCLVYYQKNTVAWLLFAGALIGFGIHVRSVGFAVLFSFIIYSLFHDFKNRSLSWRNYLSFFLSFTVVYAGLTMLYPLNSSYSYFNGEVLHTSANHLSYNLESISNFFKSPELSNFYFITHGCAYAFLTFMVIGFFIELKTNPFSFLNILTTLFFGVVVLYHFGDAGIRLILPLLFIFFYYFCIAFKATLSALQFNYKVVAVTLCLVLFCTYYEPLQKIRANAPLVVEGPCTPESAQAFAYMKNKGIVRKNIGFDRPRALALFTGNKSVHLSDGYLAEEVKNYNLDYVLVHKEETSEAKKNIIYNDTLRFKKIFANPVYELFKVRK